MAADDLSFARRQALLYSLAVRAFRAGSRRALIFHLLNDPQPLSPFHRAALWEIGGGATLLGVSGLAKIDPEAPLPDAWRDLATALADPARPGPLTQARFPGAETVWQTHTARFPAYRALWLPLSGDANRTVGLWFERWSSDDWKEEERALLDALMDSYGAAWKRWQGSWFRSLLSLARPSRRRAAIAAVLLALLLWPAPLRIVAPCEVVPADPWVVAAPQAGIIEEVPVAHGQTVAAGGVLFAYDRRLAREAANLAARQAEVTAAELQRAEVQGMRDPEARAELEILRRRLEQQRLRQEIAKRELAALEVLAPQAGTVLLDDPHAWRGRAVRPGERVMLLVQPGRTRVRAWVAETDRIRFVPDRPARVILDARPGASLPARLGPVAHHAAPSPRSVQSFQAEADWIGPAPEVEIGQQGTILLYGERTPWLWQALRKPVAWARRAGGL